MCVCEVRDVDVESVIVLSNTEVKTIDILYPVSSCRYLSEFCSMLCKENAVLDEYLISIMHVVFDPQGPHYTTKMMPAKTLPPDMASDSLCEVKWHFTAEIVRV